MAYPTAPQVNISAARTAIAPVMASAAAVRRVLMSFLSNQAITGYLTPLGRVAQRAVVEPISWKHSPLFKSIYTTLSV